MKLELGEIDTPLGVLRFARASERVFGLAFAELWPALERALARRLGPLELCVARGADDLTARLDADTNADRKPDVIQYFKAGAVSRQDEDTNFDGVIDQRFEGGKPVALPPGTKISTTPLGPLDCGRFSEFWTAR